METIYDLKPKEIIFMVLYCAVCFGLSVIIIKCSDNNANEKVQTALDEANKANLELKLIREEVELLKDISSRTEKAIDLNINAIQEAQDEHDKRISEINDTTNEWLICDLPDSLRDTFGAYCHQE